MDYSLLDEAWIPVLFKNGETIRLGMRDALAQASQIRQIAATNPIDRVAILRFLLALLTNRPSDGEPGTVWARHRRLIPPQATNRSVLSSPRPKSTPTW